MIDGRKQNSELVVSIPESQLETNIGYDREGVEWLNGYIQRQYEYGDLSKFYALFNNLGSYFSEFNIARSRETIKSIWLILLVVGCFAGMCQVSIGQKLELVVQKGHSGTYDLEPFEITSLAFSPANWNQQTLASGGEDFTIKLWDTSQNKLKLLRTLNGHRGSVSYLAFTPDGKYLISSSGEDNTLIIWDVLTGERKLELEDCGVAKLSSSGNMIACAAFFYPRVDETQSPISLYNVDINSKDFGEEVRTIPDVEEEGLIQVSALAFSNDGKKLSALFRSRYSHNNQKMMIRLWDLRQKNNQFQEINILKYLTEDEYEYEANSDMTILSQLVFSPDGNKLYLGDSSSSISSWNVTTKKLVKIYDDFWGNFALSSDGTKIVATDCGIGIWKTTNGKQIKQVEDVECITEDEQKDKKTDTEDESEEIYSVPVVFSRNEKLIAYGGGTLTVYDIRNDSYFSFKSMEVNTNTEIKFNNFTLLNSNGGLYFGSEDNYYQKYTFSSDNSPYLVSPVNVNIVGVSEGFLVSGEAISNLDDVGEVDLEIDGKVIELAMGDFEFEKLSKTTSLAFCEDGKFLISGHRYGEILVWNIEKRKLENFFREHTSEITSIRFHPNNDDIFFTSDKHSEIKVWRTNGNLIASWIPIAENDWLVATPEGLFDGTPNAWRQLIWRFDKNTYSNAPVEAFFKEFYHPGLLQDIFLGNEIDPPPQDLSRIDIRQPFVRISAIDSKVVDSSTFLSDEISADKKSVRVKVEVTDNTSEPRPGISKNTSSDAQDIRLFRNGSLVRFWENNAFALTEKDGCRQFPATDKSPRRAVCETDVQITAGENEFSAYAFNHDNVKSNDAKASVKGDFPKQTGTLYVLAVGVNNYANSKYDLRYAVPDAQELSDQLKLQQQKLGVYKDPKVILLKDSEATKAHLLYALERFSKGDQVKSPDDLTTKLKENLAQIKISQPEDAILVYFSGHGFADKDRFYLIPHDLGVTEEVERVTEQKLKALREHSISDIELEERFRSIDAGQLLLIIDACNSGQALETSDEKRRGPMNSRGLAQLAYEKGMYILTASESFQYARETSNLKHGALTYALLEGMKGGRKEDGFKPDADGDGEIFEREWFSYATKLVPQLLDQKYIGKSVPVKEAGKKYGSIQTPRVFYRRETNANPLLIARF